MAKRVPAPRPNPRLTNPIYDSGSKADQHELERLADQVRTEGAANGDAASSSAQRD